MKQKLLFTAYCLLLFFACDKQVNTKQIQFTNLISSSSQTIRGGLVCTCNSGDNYNGKIELSGVTSEDKIFMVFSADKKLTTTFLKLQHINGFQSFYNLSHAGYNCGTGALFLVKKKPVIGDTVEGKIAHNVEPPCSIPCSYCDLNKN